MVFSSAFQQSTPLQLFYYDHPSSCTSGTFTSFQRIPNVNYCHTLSIDIKILDCNMLIYIIHFLLAKCNDDTVTLIQVFAPKIEMTNRKKKYKQKFT